MPEILSGMIYVQTVCKELKGFLRFVAPDLGLNCLQRLQQTKVVIKI